MLKHAFAAMLALGIGPALADDTKFSTHLHAKFHHSACLTCHQFFTKNIAGTGKKGLAWNTHFARKQQKCTECHTTEVSSMEKAEDWFADQELDYTGMGPKETCEFIKTTHHGKTGTPAAMLSHLMTDPRILWGIKGGLPNSGKLPMGKKAELIPGDIDEWRTQVAAWINGGMKCE
jgi:hypothetical protein